MNTKPVAPSPGEGIHIREVERLHSLARHNEATALRHARDVGSIPSPHNQVK